jgi:uncharacterized protein (DUF2249 family)/quercetin dioxygenase-like cupin family protein
MTEHELDVRSLRKLDKHPTIFQTFDALTVGESFVLVNNHDPKHLRAEFDTEHPRGFAWDCLETGPGVWRIRIGRITSTALPRILGDTMALAADSDPDASGAIWKLSMSQRDLDSNVIQLPPGASIEAHAGPDIDVLVLVLGGTGCLSTELDRLDLQAGTLVWLPRRSRRAFTTGPEGLTYLTVHQRKQSLGLSLTSATPSGASKP